MNVEKTKNESEVAINQKLFLICVIVTLATMALMVTDFFTRGVFVSAKMDFFYLMVVVIYSLHKELLRWLGEKQPERDGEYFVYAWVFLTTVLYIINFFSHDFFSYSREGTPVGTLRDISIVTVEILAVFILTRFLKLLENRLRPKV
ncbi:hypothetical protein KKH63_02815 [Patescibacteria group bacterium]|nr:hypothetical protein [Patescibacteria group bacterium]